MARGPYGGNADYVLRLAQTLAEEGMADPYVEELAQALLVETTAPASPPGRRR
ncbi:hypothetical protein GALL_396290 [mine drainage metagenome]|uniref:Gamma-glutamylcyclotransferase n=1 Tax=mine drainage metagenome TaxID=410659 RepID=A0A1J5Q5L4_9ZZZZ